eukprot:UN24329
MLVLFAYIIIKSEVKDIYNILDYLKFFHCPKHPTSQLDYSFATFQGSIQFIEQDFLNNKKNHTIIPIMIQLTIAQNIILL